MKKILKVSGIILILIIIIISAAVGNALYKNFYWDKQESLVSMSIEYSESDCSKNYPLKIVVKNNSGNVVNRIEWDIGVFNNGYSTDLVSTGYHEYSNDKILNENETWSNCYAIPKIDGAIRVDTFQDKEVYSKLAYTIKDKHVLFNKSS